MTALVLHTPPREMTAGQVRANDEVAFFATHYTPGQSLHVATAELAALGDIDPTLIEWRGVMSAHPSYLDDVDDVELRVTWLAEPWGAETVALAPNVMVVVRETVLVEPWDLPAPEQCGVDVDGLCCLPTGHAGGHDPDPVEHPDAVAP